MAVKKSSKSVTKSGTMSQGKRDSLSSGTYAFPEERKEPLNNASHVRNAIARFNQVEGVSETERSAAFRRIKTAAKKFGVEMTEDSRSDLKKTAKKPAKKTAKKTGKKTK
jgi:hypothetical protein